MKTFLRNIKHHIYHNLRLYPVYRVLAKINSHYPLKGCSALEAFAYTGELQTRAFKKFPSYLEAWEIESACKEKLIKNLPGATIRITNSFEEIKGCERKFDFINVDTHQGIFGPYCENFEFFPLLFNVTKNECIVNLNVIPQASESWKKKYKNLFSSEHLMRRKAFYKTDDPANVTLDQMLKTYSEIAATHGYKIIWHNYQQRTLTYYLSLHLSRS